MPYEEVLLDRGLRHRQTLSLGRIDAFYNRQVSRRGKTNTSEQPSISHHRHQIDPRNQTPEGATGAETEADRCVQQ
jgi:hypothetical protein